MIFYLVWLGLNALAVTLNVVLTGGEPLYKITVTKIKWLDVLVNVVNIIAAIITLIHISIVVMAVGIVKNIIRIAKRNKKEAEIDKLVKEKIETKI